MKNLLKNYFSVWFCNSLIEDTYELEAGSPLTIWKI